jgi:hypothetical protein
LSIAITTIPAATAFAATGTSAFESAGAMTIAAAFATIGCGAARRQVELRRVVSLIVRRTVDHRDDEWVVDRLHDERNPELAVRDRRGARRPAKPDRRERGRRKHAAAKNACHLEGRRVMAGDDRLYLRMLRRQAR